MDISPELSAWCAKAQWQVLEHADATELRGQGSALNLSIAPLNPLDGKQQVFEVDHAGHAHWVIEAAPEDVERYLAVRLAPVVRSQLGLEDLAIPAYAGQEALGFTLDFEDVVVVVQEGEVDRAFFPKRTGADQKQAWVEFTHYAGFYLPELYAALAEADGDGPFAPA